MTQRKHYEWEFARDVILFFAGLLGIFYELVIGVNDPGLLVIFAAMLGLPITLHSKGKNGN